MTEELLVDYDYAHKRLDYDADTGVFHWKIVPEHMFQTKNAWSSWNSRHGWRKAGKSRNDGYVSIRLTRDGVSKSFLAHRLAWLMVHGDWPITNLDHISGDPSDNRISNLRLADHKINSRNTRLRSNNKTGVHGVSWSKHAGKWLVRITHERVQMNLGYYVDFDQALSVRRAAEAKLGYHQNHGRE